MSISNAAPVYAQAGLQSATSDPTDPLSNPWVVGLIGVSACSALAGTGCLLYAMRPDSLKPRTLTDSYSGEQTGNGNAQFYDRTAAENSQRQVPAAPPSLAASRPQSTGGSHGSTRSTAASHLGSI